VILIFLYFEPNNTFKDTFLFLINLIIPNILDIKKKIFYFAQNK